MPRTIKEYPLNAASPDAIFTAVQQYMQSEGYEYLQYENENVFKKGKGLMTGPSFFKLSFGTDLIRLEGWMKFAILPGVYAGESALDSFMGFAVKEVLKNRFAYMENIIRNHTGGGIFQPAAPRMPQAPARFCSKCGKPLDPDSRFCAGCGQQVEP